MKMFKAGGWLNVSSPIKIVEVVKETKCFFVFLDPEGEEIRIEKGGQTQQIFPDFQTAKAWQTKKLEQRLEEIEKKKKQTMKLLKNVLGQQEHQLKGK